jgi:hypothetical protein
MKSFKFLAIIGLASFLFTSCASVAHIEKDDTVNLSNYKTFAWAVSKEDKTDDSAPKSISLTEQNIRKAVNAELEKEGWKEVKGRPEVLLSYDVLVEKAVKEDSNPVYSRPYTRYLFNPYTRRWLPLYYPSQFLGYSNGQYETREGTVTITMVDAQTGKQIWQGWTTDEVNSKNLTKKEIQSSVKSIFRKFDVAKR